MRRLILCLIIAVSCCPLAALAYDNDLAHPALAQATIDLWNQYNQPKLSVAEGEYIKIGSSREDQPEWRTINHFLDPFGGGLRLWADESQANSLVDWSTVQDATIFAYDASWQAAISDYLLGRRAAAMEKIGHLLHLLADAAVPAHTRNDEHLLGDPYERWVKQTYLKQPQLLQLSDATQPNVSCVSYKDCLRQMAIFTNRHFFSADTINNQSFYEPYDSLQLFDDGYAYADGRRLAFWQADQKKFILNDVTHLAAWQSLKPYYLAYSQEMIRLFFSAVGQPMVLGVKISSNEALAEGWSVPVIDMSVTVPLEFSDSGPVAEIFDQRGQPLGGSADNTPISSGEASNDVTDITSDAPLDDGSAVTSSEPIDTGGATTSSEPLGGGSGEPSGGGGTVTSSEPLDGGGTATSSEPLDGGGTATSSEPILNAYEALRQDLWGLWHFDETQPGWLQDRASAGPLYSSAESSVGKFAGGVRQPYGNEYLIGYAALSPLMASSATIAIWFQDASDYPLNSARPEISLMIDGGRAEAGLSINFLITDYFFQGERAALLARPPLDHDWHLIALTYGPTDLSFYVDGQLLERLSGDFSLPSAINGLTIVGANAPALLDELAIWRRQLNGAELAAWLVNNLPLAPL